MHQHVPQSSLVSRVGLHRQTVGKQTGYLTNLSPPPPQHSNRIHLKPQPQSPQNYSHHHHTQSQGSSRNTNAARRLSRLAGSAAPRGKHGCLERIEGKQRMQARCNKKWKGRSLALAVCPTSRIAHHGEKRYTKRAPGAKPFNQAAKAWLAGRGGGGGRGRAGHDVAPSYLFSAARRASFSDIVLYIQTPNPSGPSPFG